MVCRKKTAELINRDGTEVRIKLRDEATHRAIFSARSAGTLDAVTTTTSTLRVMIWLVCHAEPYHQPYDPVLMIKIEEAKLPCLFDHEHAATIQRIPALGEMDLEEAYTNAQVWGTVRTGTGCQLHGLIRRPSVHRKKRQKVLYAGLPTNFKAAAFADEKHNRLLRDLEADIDAVSRPDGWTFRWKLKVFDPLFVPLAKWSMLLIGNYRCTTPTAAADS